MEFKIQNKFHCNSEHAMVADYQSASSKTMLPEKEFEY